MDSGNSFLTAIVEALKSNKEEILKANQEDIKIAKENGIETAILSRLKFDEKN